MGNVLVNQEVMKVIFENFLPHLFTLELFNLRGRCEFDMTTAFLPLREVISQ